MRRADAHASQLSHTFANEITLRAAPARANLLLVGQNDDLVTVTVHGVTIATRDVFALPAHIGRSPCHYDYSKYRLYPDVTHARVRLLAENMPEQHFLFVLRRDYEGQVVSIAEIAG